MSEVGAFRIEGAFAYATATDARTAKKGYAKIAAKVDALAAMGTFTTKAATFAGDFAAAEREVQELRWCLALQALREAAERAHDGHVDVVLFDWRDRQRILAGGALVCVPDEPPEGARRLSGASFRTAGVKCLAAAPDGSWIAVGAESSAHFTSLAVRIRTAGGPNGASTADVRLFDREGRVAQVFSLDVKGVHALWVRPDGEALVAATSNGLFALDRASGRCLSLKRGDNAHRVVGSPSGGWVAGTVGKELCFFDAVTWKKIAIVKQTAAWLDGMTAEREEVVVDEPGKRVIYDGASGKRLRERAIASAEEVEGGPRLAVALPDGGRLCAYERDSALEGADGAVRARIPIPNVSVAVVARDRVYVGGGARIVPVEIASGRVDLDGHASQVRAFAFAEDGKQLASLGWGGEIIVWDLATRAEVSRLSAGYGTGDHLVWLPGGFAFDWSDNLHLVRADGARDDVKLPTSPKCMRVSPGGRWLVVGGYQKLMAIDLARGELHAVDIPDWVEDVAFADEDRVVAACHEELAVLDLAARRFVGTAAFGAIWLTAGDGGRVTAWGRGARVTLDGAGTIVERAPGASHVPSHFRGALCRQAMADSYEHVVQVRAHGTDAWRSTSTASEVTAMAFAPGGAQVASGHADGSILLWEVAS